jgi:hypothetical protein
MAKERNRAAKVIRQLDDRLEVEHNRERLTVAMKGFPAGFIVPTGARVILVDEESGVVARPLVRAITTGVARPEDVARRAPLDVQGRRVEMQPSTVVDERPEDAKTGAGYTVWVVDSDEPQATEQAIAVRRE